MAKETRNNNSALVIIAIITLIGTVIAAIIAVIGNYRVEEIRQKAELTRIALAATIEAEAKATPKLLTITLTNNNCIAQDFYVDGKLMISSIKPNSRMQFNINPGEHQVLICEANTNYCAETFQVEWPTSIANSIGRALTCP